MHAAIPNRNRGELDFILSAARATPQHQKISERPAANDADWRCSDWHHHAGPEGRG
jgi:hypothetical protein